MTIPPLYLAPGFFASLRIQLRCEEVCAGSGGPIFCCATALKVTPVSKVITVVSDSAMVLILDMIITFGVVTTTWNFLSFRSMIVMTNVNTCNRYIYGGYQSC